MRLLVTFNALCRLLVAKGMHFTQVETSHRQLGTILNPTNLHLCLKNLYSSLVFCSHWRSYQYYTESVIRPIGFKATECPSWTDYKSGACAFGRTIHMGYGVDTK